MAQIKLQLRGPSPGRPASVRFPCFSLLTGKNRENCNFEPRNRPFLAILLDLPLRNPRNSRWLRRRKGGFPVIRRNRVFNAPEQGIYSPRTGYLIDGTGSGRAAKTQLLALVGPGQRDVDLLQRLEVERARLAPVEDRSLDIGRKEREPQDAAIVR